MMQAEINKRNILIDYARRFDLKTFIETGTYKGDTVKAMLQSHCFEIIHTIDIYVDRVQKAKRRYASFPQVYCWHGDSAVVLPELLADLTEPALFWLDAHHSGKQIARQKGLISTPIVAELQAVLAHDCAAEHVLLIDDYRYMAEFGGQYASYPTEEELRGIILGRFPEWTYEVKNDILRCHRAER